jgi:uncharacterized protein (TIGR03437 family)
MRPLFILALTSACIASAQFSGLSATADGSSVYFSSTLRLRGTTESFNSKIFELDAGGPRLSQARDPGQRAFNTTAEFYSLVAPQVADDGSVLAFTGTRPCNGGSSCLAVQTVQGTIVDSSGQEILRAFGYVNISPSGQWAVFSSRNNFGSPSLSGADLVDLSTGMQVHVPHTFYGPTRRRIADDGTIAFFDSGAVVLWRSDGQQTIRDTSIPFQTPYPEPALMISNEGKRVVYQNVKGLVLYDRTQAAGITVASGNPTSVTISDDARTIAWIGGDFQIGIASPTGVDLPSISEGVAELALSGDGQVLFAATRNGRILTISLPLGTTAELIPRTPWITNPPSNYPYYPLLGISAGVSAGSLAIISGTGLSDLTMSATPPTTGALGDVRILIGGMDVPVEAISPTLIWFQVPWELAPQDYPLQYLSGSSPFETSPSTITVQATAPQFLRNADGLATAVHGDWSGLVDWPNFAHPGELIYVYMTGLGPVNPSVPTGAATPDTPLSYVAGSLTCQFFGNTVFDAHDATVEFAGLAPGMVGIYQVSLRVPEGLFGPVPEYTFGIGCGFGSNFPGGIIGVIPSN